MQARPCTHALYLIDRVVIDAQNQILLGVTLVVEHTTGLNPGRRGRVGEGAREGAEKQGGRRLEGWRTASHTSRGITVVPAAPEKVMAGKVIVGAASGGCQAGVTSPLSHQSDLPRNAVQAQALTAAGSMKSHIHNHLGSSRMVSTTTHQ